MTYADLTELKNEVAVKAAGKYRQQGKEYVVQDGDVSLLHYLFLDLRVPLHL